MTRDREEVRIPVVLVQSLDVIDEKTAFQRAHQHQRAHQQLVFKIGGGDKTYIDDSEPGLVVVRKVKNDQPVLIIPASIAHQFGMKPMK